MDITTYLIKSTTPNLEFEELIPGESGKVGSTYVDRSFHHGMSSKFLGHFERLGHEKKGPGSRFMMDFERIKQGFEGDASQQEKYEITLNMPGLEHYDYDAENRTIILKK